MTKPTRHFTTANAESFDKLPRYWRKTPAVFKNPLSRPFATEADVFEWLRVLGERHRSGNATPGFRFYIDNAWVSSDYLHYLPEGHDHSMDEYIRRVTAAVGGRSFVLVGSDVQALHPDAFERSRTFLDAVFGKVGRELGRCELTLFVGNARNTPFGVHNDTEEVFTFVARGPKKLRLWHEDYENAAGDSIQTRATSCNYGEHLEGSWSIEGGVEDVLYWPNEYWHVGENEGGGQSISVALGIESASPQLDAAGLALAEAGTWLTELRNTSEVAAKPVAKGKAPRFDEKGPRRIGKALKSSLSEELGSGFEDKVREAWAAAWTGYHFKHLPDPLPDEPIPGSTQLKLEDAPFAALPGGRGIICAARGASFRTPNKSSYRQALAFLQKRKKFTADEFVQRFASARDAEDKKLETAHTDMRTLLELLYMARALVRV